MMKMSGKTQPSVMERTGFASKRKENFRCYIMFLCHIRVNILYFYIMVQRMLQNVL